MSLSQEKRQTGHSFMEAIKGGFVFIKYAGLPNIFEGFL